MATTPVTAQALIDAATDAETLDTVINGPNATVNPRHGGSISSLRKVLQDAINLVPGLIGVMGQVATLVTNINTINTSGIYRVNLDPGTIETGVTNNYLILHIQNTTTHASQLAFANHNATNDSDRVFFRVRDAANTWGIWKKLLTDIDIGKFFPDAYLVANADVINSSGIFRITSDPGTIDPGVTTAYFILNFRYGVNFTAQIAIANHSTINNGDGIFWRLHDNNIVGWGAWKKLATAADFGAFGPQSIVSSDFNSINKSGAYYGIAQTTEGSPYNGSGYVHIFHSQSNTLRSSQTAIWINTTLSKSEYAYRARDFNGIWQGWENASTQSDLTLAISNFSSSLGLFLNEATQVDNFDTLVS
ncbi:MAG: pyocin knob domain-containing protein [Pseudomonadales bacterium]|jgi:hypothetical protein|nr:pyocin knob domain-containing protein [Pseudomonadales bacterium]